MSTLDVVAEVLREIAPRAAKAREIASLANGRLRSTSKTPETVISRDLAIDVRDRGATSRFLRVDRGAFVLKEALPMALYNEVDGHAASWLKNLAAAGEIAAGVVDERSIRDLKPADVASYRQFHAFGGIGIWSRALRDAGVPDDANVWSGSCPCTPFSAAGRKRGFDDDRHLWPDWFRLIAACRPSWIVGEQVSSKDGLTWVDVVRNDLEGANYAFRVLDTCAAGVGAPHRRQRFYFVAHARERGREIFSAPWVHGRGQRWDDTARRCEADGGDTLTVLDANGERREGDTTGNPAAWYGRIAVGGRTDATGTVSDAASARPCLPQDGGADRRDAIACTEAIEWWTTGDLELERGRDDDGAGCCCRGSLELVDAGLARGRRDAGEVPGAEGAGEGEWIEARDLADEPVVAGTDDGAGAEVVRRSARIAGDESRFHPGDRIRLAGDPTWGGSVRGYWAEDVEWIYCRPEPGHQDGRWRPAKSGLAVLADGAARGVAGSRASQLKGLGNAIVLPLATAFVESVIDAFADAALTAEVPHVETALEQPSSFAWTGPLPEEVAPSGMLLGRVPGDRWPYGPPSAHEGCCRLFPYRGNPGGLFCDCAASAADDVAYGVGA